MGIKKVHGSAHHSSTPLLQYSNQGGAPNFIDEEDK